LTASSSSRVAGVGSPDRGVAGEYLPIADHGLVGDLHTVALVGTSGTIDWFCYPSFDSPSVFGSLLDATRGGFFALAAAVPARTRQFYLPDTNVLITRFFAEEGVGEIQDFMPLWDSSIGDGQRLIRRVQCVRGTMAFQVRVAPRFNYGSNPHVVSALRDGVLFTSSELSLYVGSTVPMAVDEQDAVTEFTLEEGGVAAFSLAQAGPATDVQVDQGETLDQLMTTVRFWWRWLSASRYKGRWREVVHRSALTLKLLTYVPTGAIIAAPTTSLPEQIGGERNWDYRYVWIRDAAFCVYALLRLGFDDEATAFMNFLTRCARPAGSSHAPLQVMYGIDGRTDLAERELPDLEGYRGSTPVRVGNGAARQLQLDIYGELMDSVYLYDKWAQPISSEQWEAIRDRTDWVCANWDQPDEGIWETRGGRKGFLYSRLMCWVAVERAIRLAVHRGLPADQVYWCRARDDIYSRIMDAGWSDERQAFVQDEGSSVLDAAVLMMPLAKFIAPTDPKWLATLDELKKTLVSDSLVYRYDPEASPDGLRGREGTFTVCSFWYVEALARAGRLDEARIIFEKTLTYANHVGLYAEQIGQTGEQQGNFPQALTHLALISAAYNLDRALG
jgi:GH15 family glucan-1,4-alpha-glucosidase